MVAENQCIWTNDPALDDYWAQRRGDHVYTIECHCPDCWDQKRNESAWYKFHFSAPDSGELLAVCLQWLHSAPHRTSFANYVLREHTALFRVYGKDRLYLNDYMMREWYRIIKSS